VSPVPQAVRRLVEMLGFFQQALTLLTPGEKRRLYLILALSSFAALMQTLSVLSMMPFIVLLANPDMLEDSGLLQRGYEWLGAESYHEFLVVFGLFGILVLTLGNMFVAFEQWVSDRYLNYLVHRVETKVLQRMMRKPYDYFVTHHSAKLSDIILSQVERAIEGVIGTFITIFGSVVLAGLIVLMLLLISFKTTLVTFLGLLAAYVVVFLLLRRKIQGHGAELTELSAKVFTAVKETLDGIREIKSRRAEAFFIRRFDNSRRRLAGLAVRYNVLSYLPHFLLETIVLAGFVAVALYFVYATADSGISLSFIALYGMAIYRLIPALKGIFEGISTVHHDADAVQLVVRHIEEPPPRSHRPLAPPKRRIQLTGVTHRYADSDRDQLSDLTLTIPVGSSICLYGPSGSGKTTVLNVLAGLIRPRSGAVLCDGAELVPEALDGWRRVIGYCPQQIYLYDDTLASNIAFGIDDDAIDYGRIHAVGRIARLEEFVLEKLPGGYQAVIGEHGATLSGGQRQRVGIARCLYHDPEVLFFDESFNGLDAENRTAILDSLFSMQGKTLVFSSHETAIASRCDVIVMMEQGKVVAEGTYEVLMAESPRFEQLASRCGA
jgi:ATP-binding cassette, subfamily B, bacterial PglK